MQGLVSLCNEASDVFPHCFVAPTTNNQKCNEKLDGLLSVGLVWEFSILLMIVDVFQFFHPASLQKMWPGSVWQVQHEALQLPHNGL